MNGCAFALPLFDRSQRATKQIAVETAAQTAIGADDDEADGFRFAFLHERMLEIRIGLAQVTDHRADALRIRTRRFHALLCLAHLARRHHLHGFGDLLSIFDTRDLNANFFSAGHSFSFAAWPLGAGRWPELLVACSCSCQLLAAS